VLTALIFGDADRDRLSAFTGHDAIVFRVASPVCSRHGLARAGWIGLEPPE